MKRTTMQLHYEDFDLSDDKVRELLIPHILEDFFDDVKDYETLRYDLNEFVACLGLEDRLMVAYQDYLKEMKDYDD